MLALICVFCSMLASALYGFTGEPGGVAGILELIAAYLASASIALWVHRDAAAQHKPLPYDLASFFFFLWPFAAPVYLFRTRGWRALGPICAFIGLSIVALFIEALLTSPNSPSE